MGKALAAEFSCTIVPTTLGRLEGGSVGPESGGVESAPGAFGDYQPVLAYRKKIKLDDPKRTVLTDLPFRAGAVVEVLVIEDEEERKARIEEFKRLLKDTQSLPQAQTITEAEIAAEIIAHREGR